MVDGREDTSREGESGEGGEVKRLCGEAEIEVWYLWYHTPLMMMTPLVLSACRLAEYDSKTAFLCRCKSVQTRPQAIPLCQLNKSLGGTTSGILLSLYLSLAPYFRFFLNITARLFLSQLSVFPSSRGNSAWPYTLLCGQVRGRAEGGTQHR